MSWHSLLSDLDRSCCAGKQPQFFFSCEPLFLTSILFFSTFRACHFTIPSAICSHEPLQALFAVGVHDNTFGSLSLSKHIAHSKCFVNFFSQRLTPCNTYIKNVCRCTYPTLLRLLLAIRKQAPTTQLN